ncbi:MAG: NAD-glutamate dehydrogenase, partial [Alphaproteobacteria bacterium]
VLSDELLSSNLPDDPLLFDDLVRYFPEPLQRGHRTALEGHRLRREIIANVVTNSMVNRVGPSFVHEMQERIGLGASDVARAYAITRDAFDLRRIWAAIEALDGVAPAVLQTEMLIEVGRLVERSTLWFLAHGPHPLDVARMAAEFRPGIAELMGCLGDILSPERRERRRERAGRLSEQGVPADLARRVASLEDLVSALDIVKTARMGNRSVREVGQIYFAVGERFGLDWLRAAALRFVAESDWQRMAVGAIVDDVYGHQAELTVKVMSAAAAAPAANGVIECWVAGREQPVQRAAALFGDLRAQASIDIAMLAVANRQLRTLVAS